MTLSKLIKERANQLGFDACGITKASYLEKDSPYFKEWLSKEYNANMHYMKNYLDIRLDPSTIIEKGQSVIVVLLSYNQEYISENELKVSRYALGEDYHFVLKSKLTELLEFIKINNDSVHGRCFVDSAPLLERALAVKAGLGWIGKNSMLINKKLGSYVFIGELVVDIELDYDEPNIKDYCGSCNLCCNACPTGAIIEEKVIDARKCISYLTIEHKKDFQDSEKKLLNNWIFGCDMCQQMCPWNKKAAIVQRNEFKTKEMVLKNTKEEWMGMTNGEFKRQFNTSPLLRARLKNIKRNILANS